MKELIEKKMVVHKGVSRRAVVAFRKVLADRIEWIGDESSRMGRKSEIFGLPDGDRKYIANLMQRAMEPLEEVGIFLDAHIEDLKK